MLMISTVHQPGQAVQPDVCAMLVTLELMMKKMMMRQTFPFFWCLCVGGEGSDGGGGACRRS